MARVLLKQPAAAHVSGADKGKPVVRRGRKARSPEPFVSFRTRDRPVAGAASRASQSPTRASAHFSNL